jgi:hypothetical protein
MYQECRHIMPNGVRCHSPALRGTAHCYFHTRVNRFAVEQSRGQDEPLKLSVLEDRSSIQIALAQVLNALASSKLDPRRAGLFLYGLQIASQNVEHNPNILQRNAVHFLTCGPEGEELAPEEIVCNPPEDCSACDKRDNCKDYEPEEEEEED